MKRWMWVACLLWSCGKAPSASATSGSDDKAMATLVQLQDGQAEAVFASGCFWCSEKDFEKLDGVVEVQSGYIGGWRDQPSYYEVGSGATGHTEGIRVVYDPKKVSYDKLLDWFWHHVDPFDGGGQFCDRGSQYRPAIFPVSDTQREAAVASKDGIEKLFGRAVEVRIEASNTFWPAENYHQDFYKKNPDHYQRYRTGCGRDARVAQVWKSVEATGSR